MNNPLDKAKEVLVKETCLILKREEYICYVVELRTFTPQLPFGDCFSPTVRMCITWVSSSSYRSPLILVDLLTQLG
jgi:VAD1 Analog of StAR-related lipid transfer domain